MKKLIALIFVLFVCTINTWAMGNQETQRFSPDSYNRAIARNLAHGLDKNETDIANSTYLWYQQKWDGAWDQAKFDYAVEKGAANCRNPAMLAAAKTGEFGEKVLKALIVTAGDAAEAFSDWLNTNSERYDQNM